MGNTKAQVTLGKRGQGDLVLVPRSHYRRLLRRIEDPEDALTLDRAEKNSKRLLDYAEVRKRLKRVGNRTLAG
jgi:PHD/YefM family antitoxin component YafN of YafNO toxin-antitoxin module